MYPGMPELAGGNFTMTTVALGSFFKGVGNASNNYASETFNKFIEYRETIANRLESRYTGTTYPNSGFLGQSHMEVKNIIKNMAAESAITRPMY